MLGAFLCCCTIIIIIVFLSKGSRKPKNYPPGPPRWPLIGTFDLSPLSFRKANHRVIVAEMVDRYGPTIGTFVGKSPVIYLNDPNMTRRLFNMEVFSGRVSSSGFQLARSPNGKAKPYGIIWTDGELWHHQRRFSLKSLKDLGFGRTSSESVIQEEASFLVDYLIKNSNEDFSMESIMNIPVLNVLWRLVASQRLQMDDPEAIEIMDSLTSTFGNSTAFRRFLTMLPGSNKLELTGVMKFRAFLDKMFALFREYIKDHKETIDPSAPRDFIDLYLLEISKNNNADFCEDQLLVIILDLFFAGAETTSTTLKWAVLFMVLHPESQNKCRAEIEEVVGARQPSLADMGKLVYCQATILEIQRMSCTVSSLSHRVIEDTHIDGFFFPKDSIVIANTHYMMKSPQLWDDSATFQPERFIKAGKLQKDLPQMIPFSVGKRVCMGETLAKQELSVFFTTMLQRLRFLPPLHNKLPAAEPVRTGLINFPEDYFVHIQQS